MSKITQDEVNAVTAGKMKPCPFCGNAPSSGPSNDKDEQDTTIRCLDCPAWPMVFGVTPENALDQWNTRKGKAAPDHDAELIKFQKMVHALQTERDDLRRHLNGTTEGLTNG